MQIGLFPGSFNPVHTGHLIIANHILNFTSLEKIWFVVSPQNPLKNFGTLLSAEARLNLVRTATNTDQRFEASDIEFQLAKPSYTINTLRFLKDAHSEHEYYLIVGSDNFLNFSAWKSHEIILNEWKIIVYVRPGFPIDFPTGNNIQVLNPTLIDVSSTKIRELVSQRKSVRYLVPEPVFAEIKNKNYYR